MGSIPLKQAPSPRHSLVDPSPPQPQIFFLHPGYPDDGNILLILRANDGKGGLHHGTARWACAVLANCRWDGFLSLTSSGEAIDTDHEDFLVHQRYYFCVPNDDNYPVVPSFEHLSMPTSLPSPWTLPPIQHSMKASARERDTSCRVTNSTIANEPAPIIPHRQTTCWEANRFARHKAYPSDDAGIRCADNAILLRCDIRKLWDEHRFAIVPKDGNWVVHVLLPSETGELERKYHNKILQPLSGVARIFLMARFAMAVLSMSFFLRQGTRRLLVGRTSEGEQSVRSMLAHEYRNMIVPVGPRATKRLKSQGDSRDDDSGDDEGANRNDIDWGSSEGEQQPGQQKGQKANDVVNEDDDDEVIFIGVKKRNRVSCITSSEEREGLADDERAKRRSKRARKQNKPAQPVTGPVNRPMPQPVPQPVSQPASQPVDLPVPRPVSQPTPQPVSQPISQPVPQPVPESVPQSVPQPVPQSVPQPVPQSVPQSVPQPVALPVEQPVVQPVHHPAPQTLKRPVSQPVPEPAPQLVPQPVRHPVPRPVSQPVTQLFPQPVSQPTPQPVHHPVSQPGFQPVPQLFPQPVFQPPEMPVTLSPVRAGQQSGFVTLPPIQTSQQSKAVNLVPIRFIQQYPGGYQLPHFPP